MKKRTKGRTSRNENDMKNTPTIIITTTPPSPIPLQVLAVRPLGGGGHRRHAAHLPQPAGLHAFENGQRVLVRAAGEGLCEVSFYEGVTHYVLVLLITS